MSINAVLNLQFVFVRATVAVADAHYADGADAPALLHERHNSALLRVNRAARPVPADKLGNSAQMVKCPLLPLKSNRANPVPFVVVDT